jgi:hypothetical protein
MISGTDMPTIKTSIKNIIQVKTPTKKEKNAKRDFFSIE